MNKMGIDFGGTKIEGILLDDNFNILERKRIPTPSDYDSILNIIENLIFDLKNKSNDLTSIGIGIPGIFSCNTGIINHSNTSCLIGKSFQKDLEDLIEQKISIDNDSNCFALAESKLGAAKNFDVVLGIIIGTGVGAGIVINGNIMKGRNNFSGEWGHHSIHPNGKLCYCGRTGCVDQYISGPSLEKNWTELTGKKEHLSDFVHNIEGKEAFEWKSNFLKNFGIGMANIINILDPDVIVLGGGVSNISFLYDEGVESIKKELSFTQDTPILKNQLGDSSGVFGACLL
jgi:fructokinase